MKQETEEKQGGSHPGLYLAGVLIGLAVAFTLVLSIQGTLQLEAGYILFLIECSLISLMAFLNH